MNLSSRRSYCFKNLEFKYYLISYFMSYKIKSFLSSLLSIFTILFNLLKTKKQSIFDLCLKDFFDLVLQCLYLFFSLIFNCFYLFFFLILFLLFCFSKAISKGEYVKCSTFFVKIHKVPKVNI